MFSRTFSFPNSRIVKTLVRAWHVFTNFLFPKFSKCQVRAWHVFTNFLFPKFSKCQVCVSLACFHELSLSQILKLSSVSEFGMFSRTFSFPNFLLLFDYLYGK